MPINLMGIAAALGTALAHSASSITVKLATSKFDEYRLLFAQSSVAAIVLTIACVFWYPALLSSPIATFGSLVKPGFFTVLVIDGFLNVIAAFFLIRALRLSDASLIAPLDLLTPVVILFTAPLILGEYIAPVGILGVLCMLGGAYFLGRSLKGGDYSLLESFKALGRDKGVQCMLATSVIWGFTSVLDKMGVLASTPLIWSASIWIVIALFSAPLFLMAGKAAPHTSRDKLLALAPGITNGAGTLLQVFALTLLPVPYVIALKRTSAVFTVIFSALFLGESIRGRLTGSLIMLIGVVIIAFSK